MTISKAERLAKIHSEALADFNRIQSALRDERLQCLQDRRFYSIAGAQWEGPLGDAFENKPRYEFNKIHLAVIRVINEYRNNRIAVMFQPKDGTPNDELADTCAGLYRADYQRCSGDEAVDNAFEECVGGGFGAWRLRTVYEDEDDEYSDADDDEKPRTIAIEPIFDADSTVFFDLDAKRQDKADAKRCYVLTPWTWDAFKEEFGEDPASWPKIVHQNEFDWVTPRLVWVAELYRVEEEKDVVHYYRGLDEEADDMKVLQSELDDDPEKEEVLRATGFREVRQKTVKRRRIHKYLMSGAKILEDCGYIAGRCIPIIPAYGKRWVIDGVERCMGHVRLAKDAQRLANTLLSWLAEMAMRFDIEKPILTPEQIRGHAVMWANDNISKFPYLLANPMMDAQGNAMPPNQIQYTKAPNIPPAMAALSQMAIQALTDMLGNQQAGEELQPNLSGKAVELIQQRLDMQVFIYMSNLAKAVKRCGEVWLSMKKDLVVEEERRMKVVHDDGKPGSVVMNQPIIDQESGEQTTRNDLAQASLDVVVDVGPSSSSRRAATVRAVTGMLQLTQDPQTTQVLTAFAIMNLEGEGIEDIRAYFRKQLVTIGAVKPTEEEAKELQAAAEAKGQQPDPQSAYLLSAAEEAQAAAAEKRATTIDKIASAHLKTAQAAHVTAMTGHEHAQHAIDIGDAALRQAAGSMGLPPKA